MILSYESLIQRWIKNGDYIRISIMSRSANAEISNFIDRDIVNLLLAAEKTGCTKTITAILKCTIPRRLLEVKSEFEPTEDMNEQENELFGVDAPDGSEPTQTHEKEHHTLILTVIDEFLDNDHFTESMLRIDHSRYLKNESVKII